MSGKTIPEFTEITTVAPGDKLVAVDVSDTTASSGGTNKHFTKANLLKEYATLTGEEALTNKTLTSPVINTPTGDVVTKTGTQTLTNKTLTSPKLNENVELISTSTELNALNGKMGEWASWTPTWVNFTKGSATVNANYIQIGKFVHCRMSIKWAADTSISSGATFTFPVTSVTYPTIVAAINPLGPANFYDVAPAIGTGLVVWQSTTTAGFRVYTTGGTYGGFAVITDTVPWTWAVNDEIGCSFTYQAA